MTPVPPAVPPVDPELRTWQADFDAARHSQLTDVRAVADKWATALVLLIGIVGTASVLLVPKTLDKFNSKYLQHWVFWLACITGLAALIALFLAVWASQGWPKLQTNEDAVAFEAHVVKGANDSARHLAWSRWATAVAVVGIIASSACSQYDTLITSPSHSDVVVVGTDGKLHCGTVSDLLTVPAKSVMPVDSC